MFKSALMALFAAALSFPALAQNTSQTPPFSPVIVSDDTIFLAGHLGRIPGTNTYPDGGIGPQTTQTLNNIGATLATVGASHADLVRCQVFLADINDFAGMNAAYRKFFPQTPPARTTVAVSGLAANASIEIECTGRVGHGKVKTALAPRPGPGSYETLRADTSVSTEYEVIIADVVLPPNGQVKRHTHPTEEYIYIIEGTTRLSQEGAPDRDLIAGESYTIPAKMAHEAVAGPEGMRGIVVRIHPKGQPERTASD